MRISDWSSDVCSSDLRVVRRDFLQHSRAIVELVGLAYGTQGYAITLEGARRLVEHCRTVRRPIDDEMDRRSEEHTSELQSLMRISYAVFCLKKKKRKA